MTELKTNFSIQSGDECLDTLSYENKQDSQILIHAMGDITKERSVIWKNQMSGFRMRKNGITIFLPFGIDKTALKELGKQKQMRDVNQVELKKIMIESVNHLKSFS